VRVTDASTCIPASGMDGWTAQPCGAGFWSTDTSAVQSRERSLGGKNCANDSPP